MDGLIYYANDEQALWIADLQAAVPGLRLHPWDRVPDRAAIRYAVIWGRKPGLLTDLPNLKAVITPSAGVDHLLADPDLPGAVPIFRLEDAGMGVQMAEYALHWTLHFQRDFDRYETARQAATWAPRPYCPPRDFPVGVLGLGTLGRAVAKALLDQGYPVRGWTRSRRPQMPGVEGFCGMAELAGFVGGCRAVFALLPSTAETRGLADRALFDAMAPGAVFVNLGRGDLVDQAALIAALDRGHLRAAVLDVCSPEPPPDGSPLWHHPAIRLTPHVAADTIRELAIPQMAAVITALERGETPSGRVDRARGY